MKKTNELWRSVILIAFLTFMIVPVIATLIFSVSTRWDRSIWPEGVTLQWWMEVTSHSAFMMTLKNSFIASFATMFCLLILVTPTAYWMKLKVPQGKLIIELITSFSFGVPGVVLALALIRFYSKVPLPIINHPTILVAACMVLSLPFMYRPILNALEAIDFRVLTEAAQSLGANWFTILFRVIFPNLRVAILSGAFLTLATVIGEFTIASFLVGIHAFGPYMSLIGQNKTYEASSLTIISFGLTWAFMGLLQFITRGRAESLAGAH